MSDEENASLVKCANHVCEKEIDPLTQERILCALCRNVAYCSGECQMVDWVKHECPNVVHVEKLGEPVFTPYFFEDTLPEKVLAKLEPSDPLFQSYLVLHVGTNQMVSQYIQPPLLVGEDLVSLTEGATASMPRGSKPSARVEAMKGYSIRVDRITGKSDTVAESVTVPGTIPNDLVFKENTMNSRARKLAGFGGGVGDFFRGLRRRLDKATGSLFFWPDPKQVERSQEGVFFPLNGTLRVTLTVGGEDIEVRGGYDISKGVTSSRLVKEVKKNFESILKLKFPGDNSAIKFMHVIHGHVGGHHVALTMLVREGEREAQLMDVEFLVPENRIVRKSLPAATGTSKDEDLPRIAAPAVSSVLFECDPRSMDQVVGLTMAIEAQMLTMDKPDPKLENVAGIIRKYARQLMANNGEAPEDIPMEVNTAIYTATNELVGPSLLTRFGRARDAFNASKEVRAFVKKNGTDGDALEAEFNTLLNNITTLRNQSPPQNAEAEVADARYLATFARQKLRRVFVRSGELETFRQSPLAKRKLFRKKNK